MEYNEKLFEKVAIGRIKKFYELNRDAFLARAMDFKDLQQEMRIALWQKMLKYESLAEEEYVKLINKILTTKLIDSKQKGYRHMKADDVTIEEDNEEKVLKVHNNQFLNIDSIDEKSLMDTSHYDRTRAIAKIEYIKSKLTHLEQGLLDLMLEGRSEDEMACQQICCDHREDCKLNVNPEDYVSTYGNIGKKEYKKSCSEFNKLNNQSVHINRLKKQLVKKVKNIVKNM